MATSVFEEFCVYLYRKKRLLIANFVIACVAGAVYAFVILKQEFSASITFLPPMNESMSPLSLAGVPASMLAMAGGGMSGVSQDVVETVFNSNAFKRQVIDEFDLINYFELDKSPNAFKLAVKQLEEYLEIEANSRGGIGMSRTVSYNVTAYHRSPDTAKLMADFAFAALDSAIIDISINRARRNREFTETQFELNRIRIDSIQTAFMEFQVEHKAFDVTEQMELTLQVYAEVKAASLMNDIRLQMLQQEFRAGSPEITAAQNMRRAYQRQLAQFEQGTEHAVLPSLNLGAELLPAYTNLRRDLEVQNQVHLLLIRELEQARLQEARDVSPLIMIDPSFVPEYKARPSRAMVTLVVVFAVNLLFLGVLANIFYVKHVLAKSERFGEFVRQIRKRG